MKSGERKLQRMEGKGKLLHRQKLEEGENEPKGGVYRKENSINGGRDGQDNTHLSYVD